MTKDIDIGDSHFMRFVGWFPDRDLNPQYRDFPDVEKCGVMVTHLRADNGEQCQGFVHFDLPETKHLMPDNHRWQVEQWGPLTISPSVLCRRCGDHGFIREGRWVRA